MAALTAFVPFETIATATLLVCVFLFVLDPIPPATRVIAMISVFVVAILARFHNVLKEERAANEKRSSTSRSAVMENTTAMRRKNKEE